MKCFELHLHSYQNKILLNQILVHGGILVNEKSDMASKASNAIRETFVSLTDALKSVKFSQN